MEVEHEGRWCAGLQDGWVRWTDGSWRASVARSVAPGMKLLAVRAGGPRAPGQWRLTGSGVSLAVHFRVRPDGVHAGGMASWKHLLVRAETSPYNQVVLVPSVPGLDSRFTQSAQDPDVVELLDELSRRGWELVAVQGREFWLRQLKPDTSGEAHFY